MSTPVAPSLPTLSAIRNLRERIFYGDLTEDRALVAQTYVSLRAQWERIQARKDLADLPQSSLRQTAALLEQPQTWLTANALEQATASLMAPADLDVFFQIKLLEATKTLPASYIGYFDRTWRVSNHEQRGALTFRLLQALHWYYAVRQQRRLEEAKIRVRTGLLFMFSFFAFFFPTLFRATSEILFRTETIPKSLYVVTALTAGWIGATFSMMLNLNRRLENLTLDPLKVMSRFSFLLTRVMIGIGGGMLVFYALQAGVVQGKFLPDLSNLESRLAGTDLAMLIIWCFLAGFSERFVPGLLARMETDQEKDHVSKASAGAIELAIRPVNASPLVAPPPQADIARATSAE